MITWEMGCVCFAIRSFTAYAQGDLQTQCVMYAKTVNKKDFHRYRFFYN